MLSQQVTQKLLPQAVRASTQPQAVQLQKTTHYELMNALIKAGADVNVRMKKNIWFFGYSNCGNANCGLELLDGTTPFWRATYAVDLEAMKLLGRLRLGIASGLTEAIDSTLVHRLLLQVQPAHLSLARPNDPMETLEQQSAARATLLRDALAPLRASIG